MLLTPTPRLVRAVRVVKVALVGGAVASVAVATLTTTPSTGPDPVPGGLDASHPSQVAAFAVLSRAHGCSVAALGSGRPPRSALVRTDTGVISWVDLERGRAAVTGRAPGRLLAVCHDRFLSGGVPFDARAGQ